MYIKRKLESTITEYLKSPEILAVVGPRQCGKTTMLKHIHSQLKEKAIFLTFEDKELLDLFEGDIKEFVSRYHSYDYVFIDEFQYAKNGGKLLKYWFDTNPTKIIISGSSVIDLSVKAVKYLVGRVFILNLYPFDFDEFLSAQNYESTKDSEKERLFEQYCTYGGYPRVVTAKKETEKEQVLKDIYNTFFLREVRDILGLVDDFKLSKLLKLLAGQIGNLIQYRELASGSEFSEYEAKKHLNFFAKTFTCSFPKPFFTNPRTQIVKNPKVYFVDTGLRNYIVNDFRFLTERPDAGCLLENGVAMQFIKRGTNFSFWRTKKQAEVDFVTDMSGGKKAAWEIKMTLSESLSNSAREFGRLYPDIPLKVGYFKKGEKMLNREGKSMPVYLL